MQSSPSPTGQQFDVREYLLLCQSQCPMHNSLPDEPSLDQHLNQHTHTHTHTHTRTHTRTRTSTYTFNTVLQTRYKMHTNHAYVQQQRNTQSQKPMLFKSMGQAKFRTPKPLNQFGCRFNYTTASAQGVNLQNLIKIDSAVAALHMRDNMAFDVGFLSTYLSVAPFFATLTGHILGQF